MDQEQMETNKVPVPLYTKIGWIVAWVVMLGLVGMILRNCATSVIYGRQTNQQEVESFYQAGLEDGSSGRGQNLRGKAEENSVLRKAYIKGYRTGIDRVRK